MKPKSKRRVFRFSNEIDKYGQDHPGPRKWVNEVLGGIETDTLSVYDPKDTDALKHVFNAQGEELLEDRLSFAVSIQEWLPVGCQCVRWFGPSERKEQKEGVLGFYMSNAATVLWPVDRLPFALQGPSAFVGEIAIAQEKWAFEENKFKCVFAHELVHVFDMLKLLVPAFIDWRGFWRSVLNEGCACEDAARRYHNTSLFVDNYGHANERLQIAAYWPSHANAWFEAMRKTR